MYLQGKWPSRGGHAPFYWFLTAVLLVFLPLQQGKTAEIPIQGVAGQPLAANVSRLLKALDYLGAPLPDEVTADLRAAVEAEDALQIQRVLDAHLLCAVSINPELRVKVLRGPADSELQQFGYTPHLIKVVNDATVTRELNVSSPQAGAVYSGPAITILKRQAQTELKEDENLEDAHRFLDVELFAQSPMTDRLSGLNVEYLILLISSSEAGPREATLVFDIGQGTQDLGFRSEIPVLFSVRPAVPVKVKVRDSDGTKTTARLEIRDARGRVYPPQAKRLAPDFFFQPHIYRADGQTVDLPPGEYVVRSSRGPEYHENEQSLVVTDVSDTTLDIQLTRWIDPAQFGYFSGDHHIHAAGCSHYDNPTQGVTPADMFRQVKGEGLNVGCVLTWGPCFEHQRHFFSPQADTVSEPMTVLKYDLEISGFGSAPLGHVCLLNLKDQTYPESAGTKEKGWPSWTVPVMRWTKQQGGYTGYPHSALHVDPQQVATWTLHNEDSDSDQQLSADEARQALLPEPFPQIDADQDRLLSAEELRASADRAADQLPNLALPGMNGGGAMEIFVSTAAGVCDFISAMDTARIPEWNTWYHLLNCGFPLKLSGETDFPCMSSRRVGQGRVYVELGKLDQVEFADWCAGLAAGRSYVSDGYAHALDFNVNGTAPGEEELHLEQAADVDVEVKVAFAPMLPRAVAYGTLMPPRGRRMVGDTVNLHAPRESGSVAGGTRLVEVVCNGEVVAKQTVPADGEVHSLTFTVPVERSSWIAVRQFPQLHTNPVSVIVDEQPIRASRASALWCAESVRLLWKNRRRFIDPSEREAAKKSYTQALQQYYTIAAEAFDDRNLAVEPRTLPEHNDE